MSSDPPLKLGPLIEVILYAADMDSQVRFYRDELGLSVGYPTCLDSYADQFWVTFDTGACTLALHGGGAKEFGEDAPKFVFQVDDIDSVREGLKARGVPVSEIHSPTSGIRVFDAADPEGNRFSLECRSPGEHANT